MKKNLAVLIVALVAVCAFGIDDIAQPTDGSFYDGAVLAGQYDTNANTVATAYTPRRYGDILTGYAGVATGAVWVASGKTTNDWVLAGAANGATLYNAAILANSGLVTVAYTAAILANSNLITVAYKAWTAYQVDATAAGTSTVITAYTPRWIGDGLVGAFGITNTMWNAKGVTTNDWIQVGP